ncbi:glycoside hydrolase family 2 TIM barrel-domain containing protein [Mucilaginibacter ginsenosidivorax]|uniref:Cellulase family glycosylhydrolase n=1 Tax=Mucilaginibacter ginsenosidivorax TaxID=862126 RepID=A0A5B8W755_9SPHI|nr:glycoside hydrolase family 2 TIM barrel-domain containing protein [Mucilaginibacter ginsenosidivorax]QEC78722.1 cellulase family glycosylhydrolase [Mucilaginibacter ginsenosidivorax]
MKKIFLLLIMITGIGAAFAQNTGKRWTEERVWKWYNQQPWYCGFNYIPAYAINYTAMWDKTSFNAAAIDKELALAGQSGMNSLRAVLQYAVYADDPEYFLNTLDKFMAICEKHHIKFIPALFDDCSFGIDNDPKIGRQPEPLPGWYAWAWSPSPGHSLVVDSATHPKLEKYVKAVIGRFKNDPRILMWDLYNEPTNGGLGSATFPLLKKVIIWARAIDPVQPLTIGIFDQNPRLNSIITDNADLITFHDYGNKDNVIKTIEKLKQYNRPMINTEWMNRPWKSTVSEIIPVFYQYKVGCNLWGLVNGKTQTNLPWGHRPGDPEQKLWQHDLYHGDFKAYKTAEIDSLKMFIDKSKTIQYIQQHQHK